MAMYACAELFCASTNVSNKFVFRRYPLRGGSSPLSSPPACDPGEVTEVNVSEANEFNSTQGWILQQDEV